MNECKLPASVQQLLNQQNTLAKVSLILSIIAVAICIGGTVLNLWIESNKIPDKPFQPGDVTVITDKLENAVSIGEQFLVFLISHAASLTLSLTAGIMGAIALSRPNNKPARLGIALSFLAIVLIVF